MPPMPRPSVPIGTRGDGDALVLLAAAAAGRPNPRATPIAGGWVFVYTVGVCGLLDTDPTATGAAACVVDMEPRGVNQGPDAGMDAPAAPGKVTLVRPDPEPV